MLVGKNGKTEHLWIGKLSEKEQQEVSSIAAQ